MSTLLEIQRRFSVLAPVGMCLPATRKEGSAIWPGKEKDLPRKLDAAFKNAGGRLDIRIVLACGYVFNGATGMPETSEGSAWYLYCDGDALLLYAYGKMDRVEMLSPFVLDLRQVERIYLPRRARITRNVNE